MVNVKDKKKLDTKIVESRKLYCEGGNIDSGHPRVYLVIGENDQSVSCPYCGQVFTLHKKFH